MEKGKSKKIVLTIMLVMLILFLITAIFSTYQWIVRGEQTIKLTMARNLYTNSDVFFDVNVNHRENYNNSVEVPNSEIKVDAQLLDEDGKTVKNAKVSKENGIYKMNLPDVKEGNYTLKARVSSAYGKDTFTKKLYLSNGKAENVAVSFDKGIYKPGDIVSFRALITEKEKDTPISEKINISIYDGNDNRVYNKDVQTSDYGIIGGSFQLADEVNSGIYHLTVKTDNTEMTKQFKVNPYVLPKYETTISFDKEKYLVGDTAKVTVDSKYFFGEAVSDVRYVIYVNDKKVEERTADSKGRYQFDYKINEAKTYQFYVEAVDASNYYVQAQNAFSAGTDLFEIELLPEYGTLANGTKNNIFVQTKNADGSPVKTYLTVTSGKYTKQVATDELGFAKFSMDVDEVVAKNNSYYYQDENINTKDFHIVAVDMNDNKVEKTISLPYQDMALLLTTDQVKYQEGDEITVKLFSQTASNKIVSVFKNDKLLKMITTDDAETSFTLEDVYGLIDIYVQDVNAGNNFYARNSLKNATKRTIFVKPDKELNVSIDVDKDVYQPGEKMLVEIQTKDENKQNVDSALLVSMLDNAVLNLAKNDLTLDNIKLALEGIVFSNDVDAATIYTCILDDNAENSLIALLLKQGVGDSKIISENISTYHGEDSAQTRAIVSYFITFILVFILLNIRFPKLRVFILHVVTYGVIAISTYVIVESLVDYYYDFYEGWLFPLVAIIVLILYILGNAKIKTYMIQTTISLMAICIMTFLSAILVEILWDIFDIDEGVFFLLIAVFLLIYLLILKLVEKRKIKKGKPTEKIKQKYHYLGMLVLAVIISLVLGFILDKVLFTGRGYMINYEYNGTPRYRQWHDSIVIPASLIALYLFNYLFNIRKRNDDNQVEITDDTPLSVIIASLIVVPIIFLGGGILYNFSTSTIESGANTVDSLSITNRDALNIEPVPAAASSTFGKNSLFPSFGDNQKEDVTIDYDYETNTVKPEKDVEKVQEEVSEEVRNVFLESMCFIPELIAQNGTANLDLKLADNITTWTIQTVGNTKDGRVGFCSLDTVKVFKEFFVDFELPNNLVKEDKVSIPVTIYNYTDNTQTVTLTIKEDSWFKLEGSNQISQTIEAQGVKMVYVPITVLEIGTNKLRVEGRSDSYSDIIEKSVIVNPKGYKIEKVISNGMLEDDIEDDILILDKIIEGTAKVNVKIYASLMAQAIEGMENIFRMPTGCFEQVSSSLYPDIVALKYMEDNKIIDDKLKEKALEYISSGYQKLLSYEVKGESGGYSLFGNSPAETVLTAYGLMEITDLSEVYPVDEKVLEKMTAFLYSKQKSDGSFTITGHHYLEGEVTHDELALNAYITWALSESNPKDGRLIKSVNYLKEHLSKASDNYTLALIANVFANVGDKEVNRITKQLIDSIQINGKSAYLVSNRCDYYGSRGDFQTIQTVALTSMALSKTKTNHETNKQLINYLIEKKDCYGTWYSTQATILSLKAFNEANEKSKLGNQTIKIALNKEEKEITINDNPLDFYKVTFDNISKENKLSIDIESGNAYYEVVEEYYLPYDLVNLSSGDIDVTVTGNTNLKVNGILNASIKMINRSQDFIGNGMVTITIPQGFVIVEDSLMKLVSQGIIEKYEMNYRNVNLYLRDFEQSQIITADVQFRASYPVDITGLSVRAYDYYNPTVEGATEPIHIIVAK